MPRCVPLYSAAWPEPTHELREHRDDEFDIAEVHGAILRLKRNKATGPDLVRNEYIQQAKCLLPCWTLLFNCCLREGSLPSSWKEAQLMVIPKGKGDPREVSAWRGIAKKCCPYKLLSSLIAARLTTFLEQLKLLPDEQHGFRELRSTHSACSALLTDVHEALKVPGGKLYAVFVDFRAAFDTGSRVIALDKLAQWGVPPKLLRLLAEVLQQDKVVLDDGITELAPFDQTTGYAQGDNLSPLLFTVLVSDLPKIIQEKHAVKLLMYADDLVIYSPHRFQVSQALGTLRRESEDLGLMINMSKTLAMKFRRGGRLAKDDHFVWERKDA